MSQHRLRNLSRWIHRLAAGYATMHQTEPLSDCWGHDRGTPLDRFYIEQFLESHRQEIRGHVLETEDRYYTDDYGCDVERSEVLDINPSNPEATIVADLQSADAIPSNHFDCFILTQTLQYVYHLQAAVEHCHRVLRPGGVLLATVPAVSRIDPAIVDYWRFTTASCSALFGGVFGAENVTVHSYGNVLAAIASLSGWAQEEMSASELSANDSYFPIIIAVHAVKPGRAPSQLR